jgi:hypothetical protein
MRPAVRFTALAAALGLALMPASAGTWGNAGHRMVGVLAVQALPEEVPAFLRTRQAALDMGEYAREPDRSKGSGRIHDHNRDPAHFVDIDDEGRVLGGPLFAEMQPTRAEYEKALQAAGVDSWKAGYLQYATVDAYQQLVRDFGYWRVLVAAEKRARGKQKAWYKADRIRREKLLFANLANLAHYVGDGSQPLHTSAHYNGWGDYPNPEGFTNERIHGPFEEDFVAGAVTPEMARAAMVPFADCACPIEKRVVGYLARTETFVRPLYRMWGQGNFRPGTTKGADFAAERLGAGASELRDLIVLAWRDSAKTRVGWPIISVADVEAGKVDPWESLVGKD